MNRGKDVKLSTSKSNGIFLFSSAWLNLSFDMCVYRVCVLEFKHSCVQIQATCVHVYMCISKVKLSIVLCYFLQTAQYTGCSLLVEYFCVEQEKSTLLQTQMYDLVLFLRVKQHGNVALHCFLHSKMQVLEKKKGKLFSFQQSEEVANGKVKQNVYITSCDNRTCIQHIKNVSEK